MSFPLPSEKIEVNLPEFLVEFNEENSGLEIGSIEEQMLQAIDLATRNVKLGSGGPFAALIVEASTNRLLSAAVNPVSYTHLTLPTICSV